jgi:hypothetical protein
MTYRFLNFLLMSIMLSNSSFSQERNKIFRESGKGFSLCRETYFVLNSDSTIKDGPYQELNNDKLIRIGSYKNGKKVKSNYIFPITFKMEYN